MATKKQYIKVVPKSRSARSVNPGKPKTGEQDDMWDNTVKTWNVIKKIIRSVQGGLSLGGWKPKKKKP